MKLFVTLTEGELPRDVQNLTDAQRQQLAEDLETEYSGGAKGFSPSEVKLLKKDEKIEENQHYDSCLD